MISERAPVAAIADVLAAGGVGAHEARPILEAAAGRPLAEVAAAGGLAAGELERALVLARRRVRGEPLQYVTGTAGFRTIELEVGPGVLVPRPETEVVAGAAIARLPGSGTIVDACTGSGAIALAIGRERPDAHVWATELSGDALAWAERNCRRLGLPVSLLSCDLLTGLPQRLRRRIDVVVANPPYVTRAEMAELPPDIAEHEPRIALDGGGDGLDVARRLADQARRWLRPGGWLVVEIGARQGRAAAGALRTAGYGEIAVERDLAGRPRVALGRTR